MRSSLPYRRALRSATCALLLWLAALPATAQQIRRDVDVWCIQHHPCDWSAHTVVTWGGSNVVALMTPIRQKYARWGFAAYYVQREIRQLHRWGLTTKDASKIAAMPLWLDSLFDMGFAALGVYLAPKPFDRRVRVIAVPSTLGLEIAI